jgi:hypothetical protein
METGKLRPDREVTAPRRFDKVILFSVHLATVWKWWRRRMHALTLGCEGGSLDTLHMALLHATCFMP